MDFGKLKKGKYNDQKPDDENMAFQLKKVKRPEGEADKDDKDDTNQVKRQKKRCI